MQPPGSPREREWSGRIYFVRERRDANDEKLETPKISWRSWRLHGAVAVKKA
jgi:hypothetical protein